MVMNEGAGDFVYRAIHMGCLKFTMEEVSTSNWPLYSLSFRTVVSNCLRECVFMTWAGVSAPDDSFLRMQE